MKSKLTIVLAVLLLAVLAMPHTADAQGGYTVGKTRGLDKVIASGNNQAIPAVVLTSRHRTPNPRSHELPILTLRCRSCLATFPSFKPPHGWYPLRR